MSGPFQVELTSVADADRHLSGGRVLASFFGSSRYANFTDFDVLQ